MIAMLRIGWVVDVLVSDTLSLESNQKGQPGLRFVKSLRHGYPVPVGETRPTRHVVQSVTINQAR